MRSCRRVLVISLVLDDWDVLAIIDQPLSYAFIHWDIDIVIFWQVSLVGGYVEVDRIVSRFGYTVSVILQWLAILATTKTYQSN